MAAENSITIEHPTGVRSPPKPIYPGDDARIFDILRLASLYADAAFTLCKSANERGFGSYNYPPARLCGIHAVELFQNAFLRSKGLHNSEIRKRMHTLGDVDFVTCLKLRRKTAEHLTKMNENREYLVARYAPNRRQGLSEVNRLLRTIVEIELKATKYINLTVDPLLDVAVQPK
jgi:hypothetical protein